MTRKNAKEMVEILTRKDKKESKEQVIKTENSLIAKWFKRNKPNTYHETVIDRRIDNLIGTTIEFVVGAEKTKEKIEKRRKYKKEVLVKGEIIYEDDYHYFSKNKILTGNEVRKLMVSNDR